jgi:hypothetical protein
MMSPNSLNIYFFEANMKKSIKILSLLFTMFIQFPQVQAATYLVKYTCDFEASKVFAQMTDEQIASEFPDGLTKLARYHDLANQTGIALLETDDVELLEKHLFSWAQICDSDVSPVLNDVETRKIINSL